MRQVIAAHLKAERQRLNLTVDAVAAGCGIHKGSIYNYEAGTRCPDLECVIAMVGVGYRFGPLLNEPGVPQPRPLQASTDREVLRLVGELLMRAGAAG